MTVEPKLAQDVWKDAGKHVQFTVLELKRQDQKHEQEVVTAFADRYQAILRSLHIRDNEGCLRATFDLVVMLGIICSLMHRSQKELVSYQTLRGDKYEMPATKGDLFFHIRANDEAVVYEAMSQFMLFYVISLMLLMKRRAFVTLRGVRS